MQRLYCASVALVYVNGIRKHNVEKCHPSLREG